MAARIKDGRRDRSGKSAVAIAKRHADQQQIARDIERQIVEQRKRNKLQQEALERLQVDLAAAHHDVYTLRGQLAAANDELDAARSQAKLERERNAHVTGNFEALRSHCDGVLAERDALRADNAALRQNLESAERRASIATEDAAQAQREVKQLRWAINSHAAALQALSHLMVEPR